MKKSLLILALLLPISTLAKEKVDMECRYDEAKIMEKVNLSDLNATKTKSREGAFSLETITRKNGTWKNLSKLEKLRVYATDAIEYSTAVCVKYGDKDKKCQEADKKKRAAYKELRTLRQACYKKAEKAAGQISPIQ